MQQITGAELIDLGIEKGPILGSLLVQVKELEAQGVSQSTILEQIIPLHKKLNNTEVNKLKLRSSPLKINAAIKTESKEEESNLELALSKMSELTLCPVVEAASLMPDTCPSGMEFGSIPVGGAIQTDHSIIPAAHSSDLCCSMMATIFESRTPTKNILDAMEKSTLFGPRGRDPNSLPWHPILNEKVWDNYFLKGLEATAQNQLQTQGDGNHFFYLGKLGNLKSLAKVLDENGYYEESKDLSDSRLDDALVLVTHHGSRNLGAQIYKRGIQEAIKKTNQISTNIPKNLAWLDLNSTRGQEYWAAIEYAQRWTIANHKLIHEQTLCALQCKRVSTLTNAHNFVWKHNSKILHGKGATPAWIDQKGRKSIGIIPLNMASEILITLGNNNPDFLCFSPHGAGRNRSRSKTLEKFRDSKTGELDKILMDVNLKESTKDLDIRWASNKLDISESPLGYKNKDTIKQQLKEFDLAEIVSEISPRGCIMAGEFPSLWKEKKKQKLIEIPTIIGLE